MLPATMAKTQSSILRKKTSLRLSLCFANARHMCASGSMCFFQNVNPQWGHLSTAYSWCPHL